MLPPLRTWTARLAAAAALAAGAVAAHAETAPFACGEADAQVSFVQFTSPNIAVSPPALLTIKGKLSLPSVAVDHGGCLPGLAQALNGIPGLQKPKRPAVLILHGSAGVDSRGDFYERALNAAGIATLQIDMWEARGVTSVANRPRAPIYTIPDTFSALAFLAARPEIDANRIGVLGFSWGGVMALVSAEQLYAGQFGGGRKFAAHVANYPVCYGANNPKIVAPATPAQAGTQFLNLTGAPMLIQVGGADGYDNGAAHCTTLAQTVNPGNRNAVQVAAYPGATHAFDRLTVPESVPDPFGNEGSFFTTGVVPIVAHVPDVAQAFKARERAVQFFRSKL